MKITTWLEVRRYLKRTSLMFLLVALICVWYSARITQDLFQVQTKLSGAQLELDRVNKEIKAKEGTIDGLEGTITRQNLQIKNAEATMTRWRQMLFNLELARDIVAYMQKEADDLPLRKASFNAIYQMIYYAQKYEKVYQKKYPEWKDHFSWRACLHMIWVESRFNLRCHSSQSAQGAPQILEFNNYKLKDGTVNPKKEKFLYPVLCALGYKKSSYEATIDAYLDSPEEQINAYYYVFALKLGDTKGQFMAAVVAYNYWRADPATSAYWYRYLSAKHKFNVWCADVEKKIGN